MSSFVRFASAFALGLVMLSAACGDDLNTPATCTTATDCNVSDGLLVVECCAGFCVASSPGCDSGYRYITTEPEVGECVTAPMCPAALDMSVPIDMTSRD